MLKSILNKITSTIISRRKTDSFILPSEYLKNFLEEIKKANNTNIQDILKLETEKITSYLNNEMLNINIEAEREIEKLKHELYHDDLTSVYNKKYFTNYIISSDGKLQRDGTMVFIDLNKFKQINDTYGHTIGDNALEVFSSFLSSNLRENDKIIRYAGDEFVILFDTR